MRVTQASNYEEARDTIARDWSDYMLSAYPDALWMFIPNIGKKAIDYFKQWDLNVLWLSGGDNLGVNAERDLTEMELLKYALTNNIPVIGICRGLQMIHTYYGGVLKRGNADFVNHHRAKRHQIKISNEIKEVNSYHDNIIKEITNSSELKVLARCVSDDSVEAYISDRLLAIMWHPEREIQANEWNTVLIKNFINSMSNRGIILAAGRGSRMGNETAIKPKCLTQLAGKPLLNWQLDSLKSAGIKNITVVRGYRADMLTGDFEVANNDRWGETNMVASLFCAPAFNGSTIISYSDIVYDSEHIERLAAAPYDITITADKKWKSLWSLRFDNPLDDAESFIYEGDKLLEIGKKTDTFGKIKAQYMGLLKLSKKGWQQMYDLYRSLSEEKRDKIDMTSMLSALLERGVTINIVFIEGKWCEVDSYEDVLKYEKEMNTNNNWEHDWR
ncbi:MAG: gamma-glutamyl-gamma-aminobutyrate hydrolase family protein [Chitinophagales bacterium]